MSKPTAAAGLLVSPAALLADLQVSAACLVCLLASACCVTSTLQTRSSLPIRTQVLPAKLLQPPCSVVGHAFCVSDLISAWDVAVGKPMVDQKCVLVNGGSRHNTLLMKQRRQHDIRTAMVVSASKIGSIAAKSGKLTSLILLAELRARIGRLG